MLTDLESLFKQGAPWPPESESKRLQMYSDNRKRFEGEHSEVWDSQTRQRINRVIGNYLDMVSFPVILNYLKLLSLKTADLLWGEPPEITAKNEKDFADLTEASDLRNTGYVVTIDISRFGDGILLLANEPKPTRITYTQPDYWFPVVDPLDKSLVRYQILAAVSEDGKTLTVRIYDDTNVEERVYSLDEKQGVIVGEKLPAKRRAHGFKGNPVIPIPNLLTSDRTTGIDDYTDLDSLLTEIEIRCAQIASVLDTFTKPDVQGPSTALTYNPKTDKMEFVWGEFHKVEDSTQPDVKAIVWDASLQANLDFLNAALSQLHNLSEMGALIFTDQAMKTGDVTGPGMKKLYMQALAKVNRIRMRFDPALKKALSLCLNVKPRDIGIEWQDGLPADDQEIAQRISLLLPAGAMSLRRALMLQGLRGQQLEDEKKEIINDRPAMPEIGPQNVGRGADVPENENKPV